MKEFKTKDDILDFAIMAEQEAIEFYTSLRERSKNVHMQEIFREFAEEEMKHKQRLLNIQQNQTFNLPVEKIRDLKISDYLVDVKPSPDMNYADALILAMKKEKNAFRLYLNLSERIADPEMKSVF